MGLHNVTITHNGSPECNSNAEKSEEFYVRAVVPKGLLLVSRESNPDDSLWQYEVYECIFKKFSTILDSCCKWLCVRPVTRHLFVTRHMTFQTKRLIGQHN